MITLDKTKPYSQIFSSEGDHRSRFVQDGVSFDAAEKVIGDPVKILRERKEAEVAKARVELAQKEAELNTQAKALGLDGRKSEDDIRAEVEAKLRAEMEAKIRAEMQAKYDADEEANAAAAKKVAPKTAAKKPGVVVGSDSDLAA